MKIHTLCTLGLFGLLSASSLAEATKTEANVSDVAKSENDRASIQIALLLDTSGSMDGLINQARSYLWKIVNEMTLARQNGKLPHIQIALYEYGNDSLKSENQWIRQVMPLTDDLDAISTALFGLKTNGGVECCGAVINDALNQLKWDDKNPEALKMIYIAGNEEFNQGSVDYKKVIPECVKKGITVNTILCGAGYSGHDGPGWKEGAILGDGSYLVIDHNLTPPDPETPFDKELVGLGTKLNDTYVAYGNQEQRMLKSQAQASNDAEAMNMAPSVAVGRTVAKSNKLAYKNASWDMVDVLEQDKGELIIAQMEDSVLPDELKGKTTEEIKAYVQEKAKEREGIQKQIGEINSKRDAWLAQWKKDNPDKVKENTLDQAILDSAKNQAIKKNFVFEKPKE